MLKSTKASAHKSPTIAEIARAAHVAKSTASTVLNGVSDSIQISEATRQRILSLARQMGYRPNAAARSLKTGRSYAVLMVMFGELDFATLPRLKGFEDHLVSREYALQLCTIDNETGFNYYKGILESDRVDGVVLSGVPTDATSQYLTDVCDIARNLGKPIVAFGNQYPSELVDAVAHIDDVSGGEQATRHLLEHGHTRIAMIGVKGEAWSEERISGYKLAHEKAGIPVDENLIIRGGFRQEPYRHSIVDAARNHGFTAVFAVSDGLAIAAQSAVKSIGMSVPTDCAIIGYNDFVTMTAFHDPPLTSVRNPFREVGRVAAEILLNLVDKHRAESVTLPVSLIVRQSCGCNTISESDEVIGVPI